MASFVTQISSKELQRFTRFLTVGAVGTFLDFGLLLLLEAFSLPTLIANSLSFSAGVATASPGTVCGFLQMQ